MNMSLRCRKRGSVIIIIAGVFVVLLVILGSFMKTTTSRVHTTKKLGDTMLAREFATSLAALSNHYIKFVELKDKNSKLRKALSAPLEKMAAPETSEDITENFASAMRSKVKSGSEDVLTLLEKASGLNKLKWKLSWIVNKGDFAPIKFDDKTPYPREKDGVVRVYMKISYVLPGTTESVTEDYMFVSQIRIVANLIPVLSKFTLYVEDALNNGEETRLNLVSTKANGDPNNGSVYHPWILNNGKGSDKTIDNYKDLVKSPRGLVYLGGGTRDKPISLGIARGWNEDGFGSYGEDFHFFKNSNAAEGYWKTIELFGGGKGIMASDIGLCDDISDDNLRAWQAQLGGGYSQKSKVNSIFKLYGTDGAKSPTLVLGFVDSMFASVRIFKYGNDVNFLSYIDHEEDYLSGCGFAVQDMNAFESGYDVLALYNCVGGSLSYEDYLSKYASRLSQTPYNKDYLYILTNNSTANPKSQVSDSKLKSLAGYNINEKDFTAVPEGYDSIVEGVDLTDMDEFLNVKRLSIDGSEGSECNNRIAYSTSVKAVGDDIEAYFTRKGLLENGEMNLNGWVYVKSDSTLEININKCKVISQGGIIVDGGDICIKGNIEAEDGAHLTLVALSGKISVEAGVTNIDASLIAGDGQVKFLGKHIDGDIKINGNVVMRKINCLENLAAGCKLNYKDELSAMPGLEADDRSELPTLMFCLRDNPKMFD